jgi:hypothetical protein
VCDLEPEVVVCERELVEDGEEEAERDEDGEEPPIGVAVLVVLVGVLVRVWVRAWVLACVSGEEVPVDLGLGGITMVRRWVRSKPPGPSKSLYEQNPILVLALAPAPKRSKKILKEKTHPCSDSPSTNIIFIFMSSSSSFFCSPQATPRVFTIAFAFRIRLGLGLGLVFVFVFVFVFVPAGKPYSCVGKVVRVVVVVAPGWGFFGDVIRDTIVWDGWMGVASEQATAITVLGGGRWRKRRNRWWY